MPTGFQVGRQVRVELDRPRRPRERAIGRALRALADRLDPPPAWRIEWELDDGDRIVRG